MERQLLRKLEGLNGVYVSRISVTLDPIEISREGHITENHLLNLVSFRSLTFLA